MKTIKRLTASVIAAVSTAALAASMTPAFAYESTEAFVNSFNEGIDRDCAQYLIDNGLTLDEAKDAMEHYMNGKAMREARSMTRAAGDNYYYSSTSLADTEHFVLVIAATPNCTAPNTLVQVSAPNKYLTTTASSITKNSNYMKHLSYFGNMFSPGSDTWSHMLDLQGISATTTTTACAVARIQVEPSNTITNELMLSREISINALPTSNYVFTYETYAKGDVDHNGVVDDEDSTLLLEFLVHKKEFDITYADGSNHYSFVTNMEAADFNLDGGVSMIDLVKLNQHIAE